MDCSCRGVGGLEASLKLNYVLVVPKEQATMFHDELLMRGVPEQQIYEVDPNRRPRPHKLTNCGPAAVAAGPSGGIGGCKRGREKRFMPGVIKLGTYAAGGRQYNVGLRWGSVWISMVDQAPVVDGRGASEGTVADGGGASEVSQMTDGLGAMKVSPVVSGGVAVKVVPRDDGRMTTRVPLEDGSGDDAGAKMTVRDSDCENDDDDDLNRGNDDRQCNSSSTLCDDCKRWLLREYFSKRCHNEVSDPTGRHACIYKRIVDRLFVVTVTESGDGGDDEDEDDDDEGTVCCGPRTTMDDSVVGPPTTTADHTTSKIVSPPEREQRFAGQKTPAQPTPPREHSKSPSVPASPSGVNDAEEDIGKPKSKKKTFFGKLCSSNKKTKKNLEPPKTD